MKYTWIVLALAGLDQGIKQNIEDQEDQTLPRDLPCAKGWIRLHKNHNAGFPFGVMKNRPQLVQTIPLMMTSALAGALAALSGRREGGGKAGPGGGAGGSCQQYLGPDGERICGGLFFYPVEGPEEGGI